MFRNQHKYTSKEEAIKKLRRYCAYQERCHQEVRSKLLDLKIYGDDLEEVMMHLIEENFLNEMRFAQAYARGKFNMKHWGRIKISLGLKNKNITPYLIQKGLDEIDEDLYLNVLRSEAEKYIDKYKDRLDSYVLRKKTTNYLMRKGYEIPLIQQVLIRLIESA